LTAGFKDLTLGYNLIILINLIVYTVGGKVDSLEEEQILVSASSARTLINHLIKKGYSQDILESRSGIELMELDRADYRIGIHDFNSLWDLAVAYTQDDALGLHLGEQVYPNQMGVVGNLFFNSKTLGEALNQFERLYRLVNESLDVSFSSVEDIACLDYACKQPEFYNRASMDRAMAISVSRAKAFIKEPLCLESVSFQHPEPHYRTEYDRIFNCPILFDQPSCSLRFNAKFLKYRLPQRNPYLYQVLRRHANQLLHKLNPRDALTREIKKQISKSLSKNAVDADNIAEKLHMSRQTLYRKLKQEGHVFHELVEEVRKEKALNYLQNNKYNLSEIAFLLGFSELSAFSRAFKRWCGVSPTDYLAELKIKK
jgi:AraC-like DNA-binding protein